MIRPSHDAKATANANASADVKAMVHHSARAGASSRKGSTSQIWFTPSLPTSPDSLGLVLSYKVPSCASTQLARKPSG
jgi:hypothetical protein